MFCQTYPAPSTIFRSRARFQTGELLCIYRAYGCSSCNSVFLVTVHDPVCTDSGNIEDALYGSFLPAPSEDLFPLQDDAAYAAESLPGAIIPLEERITMNADRERVKVRVTNMGDRPIQVRRIPFATRQYTQLTPRPGRIPLPLRRNQPRPVLRPTSCLGKAPRHRRRNRRPLRTRRRQNSHPLFHRWSEAHHRREWICYWRLRARSSRGGILAAGGARIREAARFWYERGDPAKYDWERGLHRHVWAYYRRQDTARRYVLVD